MWRQYALLTLIDLQKFWKSDISILKLFSLYTVLKVPFNDLEFFVFSKIISVNLMTYNTDIWNQTITVFIVHITKENTQNSFEIKQGWADYTHKSCGRVVSI